MLPTRRWELPLHGLSDKVECVVRQPPIYSFNRAPCVVRQIWLCDARDCSMISTIVKPLSAQMFCFANQLACVSRRGPQEVSSVLWLLS